MEYALINNDNEIVQQHWFDDEPPTLAPEKGLVWLRLILDYDICTEDQQPGEPTVTVDRAAGTVTKHYPAVDKPVPESVTALQGLLVLDKYGFAAAYESWANAPERTFVQRAFIDKAQTWKRDDPTLVQAAADMGLTPEQLDTMFREAAKL